MPVDGRQQQVMRALAIFPDLTPQEKDRIAALDFPVYDSIVVAQLRRAHRLLSQDVAFDWKTRERVWQSWHDQMASALEDSLRLRKREPLIVALGVCANLFPLMEHGAALMAYKTIDDVVMLAQRGGINPKRERASQPLRLRDLIIRVPLWISEDREISEKEVTGWSEVSGCALHYPNPEPVIQIVECVLPIRTQNVGQTLYIALQP